MFSPILLILLSILSVVRINDAVEAEQCERKPGVISFDYNEWKEEKQLYFMKYGGYARKKYGKGKIFQNIFPQQQQQQFQFQQQIQQVIPIQNMNNVPEPEPVSTTSTEKPEEPKVLITWHLMMPSHVIDTTISKIEEGKIVEEFIVGKNEFEDANVTSHSQSDFKKKVDVTDQDIEPMAWYLICATYNVIMGTESAPCKRCTLVRACKSSAYSCDTTAVELDHLSDTYQISEITMQISTRDLPFERADVTLRVEHDQKKRCEDKKTSAAKFTKAVIMPNSVTFVNVNGLSPKNEYRVFLDVHVNLIDRGEVLLKSYVVGKEIDKCNSWRS